MDQLEAVRQVVDDMLRHQPDDDERRCGFVHLYGVSAACALLALKRGLDPQVAALAGMLHDVWTYQAGVEDARHAEYSAVLAGQILAGHTDLAAADIQAITAAIARHSDKESVDGDLAELLKDADVLQHYLYTLVPAQSPHRLARLARLAQELGFPVPTGPLLPSDV